jgi:hypothetical protein
MMPVGRARYGGQSSVEYLVGCVVVLALLAFDSASGDSIVTLLINSVRLAYARFVSAISVP